MVLRKVTCTGDRKGEVVASVEGEESGQGMARKGRKGVIEKEKRTEKEKACEG